MLLRNNGTDDLEPDDLVLLRHLVQAGCHLRLMELVNENREHEMTAAEVRTRLDRLQSLGYVTPAYWSVTAEGAGAVAPRFRALSTASKP